MTPTKILQQLFEVRDQIHLLHLNTNSYAEHKALNSFYDSWLDLTDKFVETYQGRYQRISGQMSFNIDSNIKSRDYLIGVMKFLCTDIESVFDSVIDSDLANIIADMKGLVNQTLYLLTLK